MLKNKLKIWGIGLALAFASVSGAMAQASKQSRLPDNVEEYGPFIYLPEQPDILMYHTAVGANDLLHMKKALREHPTITTIVLLNNGGGLVHIGLVVAEEIYEKGLDTYIPKDSYCASACSFVFFAGKRRVAAGRLGVHQISAPELSGEQAQFGVSDIVATLPKYGVSAEVLGIMFSTPASSMYFFKPNEIAKYGINRTGEKQVADSGRKSGYEQQPPNRPAQAPSRQGGSISVVPAKPETSGTPAPAKKPVDPSLQSQEERAVNVAALMIQAGSGTNEEAMRFTEEFYAKSVYYFKQKRPKSDILADKEAYFARWPIRRFVVDQSSMSAKCEDDLCLVRGIYDYTVSSPERNASAKGTSNFTYVLDLRDRYRIVLEDSEVISR